MLARGNENFLAPGEHGFSFFQVKLLTGIELCCSLVHHEKLVMSLSHEVLFLKLKNINREVDNLILNFP